MLHRKQKTIFVHLPKVCTEIVLFQYGNYLLSNSSGFRDSNIKSVLYLSLFNVSGNILRWILVTRPPPPENQRSHRFNAVHFINIQSHIV